MNLKVKIKGFQILKDVEFDVQKGLTVLVGPSNNGKTSIFRAIDVLQSPESFRDEMIHIHEKECRIDVDGVSLVKRRSQSKKYYVDNREVPIDEFKDALSNQVGLCSIDFDSRSIQLNFWKQQEKPFLMDVGQQFLFDFFLFASEKDKVQNVSKKAIQRTKELQNQLNQVETTYNYENQQFTKLQEEFKLYEDYLEVEKILQSYLDTKKLLEDIQAKLDKVRKLEKMVSGLENRIQIKDKFLKDIQPLFESYESTLSIYKDVIDKYEKMKKAEENYFSLLHRMKKTYERIILYNQLGLDALYQEYQSLQNQLSIVKEKLKLLSDLRVKERDIKEKINYYHQSIQKLDGFLSSFSVCPLCGQPMNGEVSVHE